MEIGFFGWEFIVEISEFQGTFTCIASQHCWGRSCRAAVAQWRHPGKPVAGPEALFHGGFGLGFNVKNWLKNFPTVKHH